MDDARVVVGISPPWRHAYDETVCISHPASNPINTVGIIFASRGTRWAERGTETRDRGRQEPWDVRLSVLLAASDAWLRLCSARVGADDGGQNEGGVGCGCYGTVIV